MTEVPTPPIAGPSNSKLCSQCQTNPSKYKCPRCSLPTCSLACSKSHKSSTGCTGERDKTAKIPLKEYGYGAMMDDYKWLEEGRRRVEGWGQEIVDKGLDRTGIVEDARVAAAMRVGEGRGRGRGRGQQDGTRGRGRGGKSGSGRVGTGPHEDQGRRGGGKSNRGRGAGRGGRGRGNEGHQASNTRAGHPTGDDADRQGEPTPLPTPQSPEHDEPARRISLDDAPSSAPVLSVAAPTTTPTPAETPPPAVFDQTIPRPTKSTSMQTVQAAKGLALAYGSGSDSD